LGVPDLNANPAKWPLLGLWSPRGLDVYRKDAVFADHGFLAVENVPSVGRSLRRGLPRSHSALFRTLQDPGVCATDLPGKPARHRSPSLGPVREVVPHRHSLAREAFYLGRCQRASRLAHLRRIRFKDPDTQKTLIFLTNLFGPPPKTICELYKARWQVELFFKWIKQHLRIKTFYGTSENAVKAQIWVAVSVYVLVAIIKKRLDLDVSLYTLLQVFSVTLFEKMPLNKGFFEANYTPQNNVNPNQLNLFDY